MIGGMLKKLQTKLKDTKTVAGNVVQAQEQQQPLTKEQILKNTSMAPKPPNAPVNTSGRPPVAPTEPPPQASNLSGEVKPLDVIAPSRTGAPDPWAKPPPSTGMFQKGVALASRFASKDPWADKYKLSSFSPEEKELSSYLSMNRRDMGNTLESKVQQGTMDARKAARYRREYDRRRR
jgi:hypothetical protein